MNISDFLSPECISSKQNCNSKKDALDILARIIAGSDNATAQTEVFDCLIARERLGSTGLGKGVAIPHGRLSNGEKTIAAFLQLENGIDYDAVDRLPVDLLFALIVPEESTDEHLQILSTLAEIFSDQSMINDLRQAGTSAAIYSILTR